MHPDKLARFNQYLVAAGGEALFRPSSAERWLNCPGSISLASRVPRDTSSSRFALEGTAAHLVFNEALEGTRQPSEWVDRKIKLGEKDGNVEWLVDAEMEENVSFSVDVVRSHITPQTQTYFEHPLTLQPLDPSDIVLAQNRGTADVALVDPVKRKLSILDLKYGKGVMVAGDSPQLLDYALMGLVTFGMDGGWDEVESVIIQPRARDEAERVKAHTFSADMLLTDFAGQVVTAMDRALDADPDLKVDPTGKWCRWCPAKTICPALQEAGLSVTSNHHEMVTASLKATAKMPPIPRDLALPDPTTLSPAEMATVLDRKKVYDAWIAAVEERAVKTAQAGVAIPNRTLAQRLGNRAWRDKEQTMATLAAVGVLPDDFLTAPALKSPTAIEKLLPKEKRFILDDLTERKLGDPYLKRVGASEADET